jgi:thymidylate kinase
MNDYDTAVKVFKLLLDRVQEKGIPLISLRPKEISEEMAYSGDYDFFLSSDSMDELFRIVFEIATETKSSFTINRYKHGKAVIVLHNQADNRSIFLELWNLLSVKDPYNKTLRYILPQSLHPYIVKSDDGSYSFTIEIEALYYLSHLYTNGKKLSTELVRYRVEYYRDVLEEKKSPYADFYKALLSGERDMKAVAHDANMELVRYKVLATKNNFSALSDEILLKMESSWRRIKRKLLQSLQSAPVVGPDGVGKTTLIEAIMNKSTSKIGFYRFKKLFRTSPIYRLCFPLLRKSLENELKWDRDVGKSEVDDRYGAFVIFNALALYPFRLIKNKLMNRFMFIDRYFHDYLLTNVRLPVGKAGLRADWKRLLAWIPESYWLIHLDASAEVIHERKTELNAEGIAAYRYGIFEMYLEKPFMVYSYIYTETPTEQCCDLLMAISEEIGVNL